MYTFNTITSGPLRSNPGSGDLSGNKRGSTAQVTLPSVRDWVRLCQQCANSEPLSETRRQPATAQAQPAVVIPFNIQSNT